MRRAHTVQQVRAMEARLAGTVPEGTLMQRAAAGLAAACASLLGQVYGARILVLAGSGDNGGDAMYAGARLAGRGAQVDVLLLGGGAAHAGGLAALRAAGGRVVDRVRSPQLALDGILGIGGRPGLPPRPVAVVAELARLGVPVVAVDVPSGIGVDTGELDGAHVQASVTVTLGTYKVGLLVPPAAAAAGTVHLVDIGLESLSPDVEALQGPDVVALLPWPSADDHKYTRGVVGVAAGSDSYTGAALLAVAGALAAPVGMVRYAGPQRVGDMVRAAHPEVVIGAGRVQCWVVGSGSGVGAAEALRRAVDDGVPVVVDADALAHVGGPLGVPALLTPHAGELARMLGTGRDEVEARPLRHARAAAAHLESTVLLKGHRTLVVAPDGSTRVNHTGTAWLGTAGAGDVLAGLCGGLLASPGVDPFAAASLGAWLHGSAGRLASRSGPITASDIAAAIPAAIRSQSAR